MLRTCRKCGLDKPIDQFPMKRDNADGLSVRCRGCLWETIKAYRQTDHGKQMMLASNQRFAKTEKRKLSQSRSNHSEKGRASKKAWAKSEAGKISRAKLRGTDKTKARHKRYYDNGKGRITIDRYQATEKGKASLARGVHKRRSRMLAVSTLTAAEWQTIKDRAGHKCHYCRKVFRRLTMDHVIPLTKGGHHIASNIVPACRSCNSSKGNRVTTLL